MASRIATEYVLASLTLPEAAWSGWMDFCAARQLRPQVFVLDNGNQEVVLEDVAGGESVRWTFQQEGGTYRCSMTGRVMRPNLTRTLHEMISTFKGDAVVNRIYKGFTMVYHYREGLVARIAECRDGRVIRIVYERRHRLSSLEERFRLQAVEEEIGRLKATVNELLDRRNRTAEPAALNEIDESLRAVSRKLFILEA